MRQRNTRQHSDTPGNIFNINESGINIGNKPESALIENGFKKVHVLTSETNVKMIACCNDAGQFLPPVLIYKGVNNKHELADRFQQCQTCA